jgi:hypothetical protein
MKICSALFFAVHSFAQVYNPGNSIIDSYEKGVRLRMNREAQQFERERFEKEYALEQQRLQLERERLDLEGKRAQQAKTTAEREHEAFTAELEKTFSVLKEVHPDLHQRMNEMNRIAAVLIPAPNGGISLKDYIEALYVVAKHASFTQPSREAPLRSAPMPQR